MVSTRPLISKSSSPFINNLVTLTRAPITIGKNVALMFHSFYERSGHLFFFLLSFNFTMWSAATAKSTILQDLFCCCCWLL